jgi:hypothetical protein
MIRGVDMNMGFNGFKLSCAGDGVFTGEGILPVCLRDAMEWETKVLTKLTRLGFRRLSLHHGQVRDANTLA